MRTMSARGIKAISPCNVEKQRFDTPEAQEFKRRFDHCLVTKCAPTLANLKAAGLFNIRCTDQSLLRAVIREWNRMFNAKGLCIHCFAMPHSSTVLIYCYRIARVEAIVQDAEVRAFLRSHGYTYRTHRQALAILRQRLESQGAFPHEIGVFLDYPLCDVVGFIREQGRACKHCSDWKVYGDVKSSQQKFQRFLQCRKIFERMWLQGVSIQKLAV